MDNSPYLIIMINFIILSALFLFTFLWFLHSPLHLYLFQYWKNIDGQTILSSRGKNKKKSTKASTKIDILNQDRRSTKKG